MFLLRNIVLGVLITLCSCSTTKNNFFSRSYHNTTSRYNAYFNAKTNVTFCEKDLEKNFIESYDKILDFYKTNKEGSVYNNKLDKAIKKATKNIVTHSIIDQGKEYCKWVDDSYLIVAKSYYYKKDHIKAKEVLKYIIGTYKDRDVVFEAQILLVKCYIETKDTYFAKIEAEKIKANTKKEIKKLKLVLSYIYFLDKNIEKSIEEMKTVVSSEKDISQKTRYTYILAQLHEEVKMFQEAYNYYKKAIKMSSDYEMTFNAKIKSAKVVDIQKNTTTEIEEELKDMLKDDKNTDYYYQIYLSLGELSLRKKDTSSAVALFSKASKNINNNNSFESHLYLAQIFYNKKNYKKAQKYYDSTMVYLTKNHKNYKNIKNKQDNLTDLVINLNIIENQDSLIMVSKMTEEKRKSLIDKIIQKAIKEEQEASRGNINQGNFGANNNNLGLNSFTQNRIEEEQNRQFGSNWYFYNNTTLTFGYSNFKKRWGKRKLEDNWRRQNKSSVSLEEYYATKDSLEKDNLENDPKKRETYLQNIPFTDEEKKQAYYKIVSAMYNSAKIYQDKLYDDFFAEKYFLNIIYQYPNSSLEPLALFNLILFYDEKNNLKEKQKHLQTLLKKHPNNKYSFLSKKEKETKTDTLYKYFTGLWYSNNFQKILNTYDTIPLKSKDNPDIELVIAVTKGQIEGAGEMIKELEKIIEKNPNHEASFKAEKILNSINKKEEVVKKELENPNETKKQKQKNYTNEKSSKYYFMVIFPKIETTPDKIKNIISDIHTENYS